MPELPEVETVKRGLTGHMTGARIIRVDQRRENLRFPFPPDFCQRLTGATITRLERRAKYLLVYLSNQSVLVMHLGMSGRFSVLTPDTKPTALDKEKAGFVTPASSVIEKHDHVIFTLSNGIEIRYNDTRRFGFMLLIDEDALNDHKFFNKLGIEPLSKDLNSRYLKQKAHNKKSSLKAFLLDQHIIAGLGNIYVCEVLFRTKLSPFDKASILTKPQNAALVPKLIKNIQSVLQEAISSGGSTLKDHRQTDGSLGYFQHSFKVYGQADKPCQAKGCTDTVLKQTQNGRSTFYCPQCQPQIQDI